MAQQETLAEAGMTGKQLYIPEWAATDPERFFDWIYAWAEEDRLEVVRQVKEKIGDQEKERKFWLRIVRHRRFDPVIDGPWVLKQLDTGEQLYFFLDTLDFEVEEHEDAVQQLLEHDHMTLFVLRQFLETVENALQECDPRSEDTIQKLLGQIRDRVDDFDSTDYHPRPS